MKYQLLDINKNPLEIFIDESAKEDFKGMMMWTDKAFRNNTIEVKDE